MIGKTTGEKALNTSSWNDAMGQHGLKIDCWTPECCLKRISSGHCPCRLDPEREEILRDKIMADILADAAEAELNFVPCDGEDIYNSLPDDGGEAIPDSGDSYEIQF